MTSEEQLKAERENKDILDNILANDLGNELIEYYKTHTQKETIDRYGLKNTTLLRKALTKLNFDFGYKRKNSPLKGRKSTRSHASYVSGGTKSSSTQRLNWMNKSAEEKEAWSKKMSVSHLNSPTFKSKITLSNRKYRHSLSAEENDRQNKMRRKAMTPSIR